MSRKIELFMTIALLCCAIFIAREGALFIQNKEHASHGTPYEMLFPSTETDLSTSDPSTSTPESNSDSATKSICIVIDAGHGGNDPGKVGVNGELEKDINLAIALQLKEVLEKENISVVLTRTDDDNLSNGATQNQKRADMQNRCQIITETNPVFTISIHQNSYPAENVSGAQVFYYSDSKEGAALAATLQNALKEHLDPSNKRQPKGNDSYYLLKKTPTPTVIVECGFLSNPTEASLLATADYQEKIVNAISLGILTFLRENHYL